MFAAVCGFLNVGFGLAAHIRAPKLNGRFIRLAVTFIAKRQCPPRVIHVGFAVSLICPV